MTAYVAEQHCLGQLFCSPKCQRRSVFNDYIPTSGHSAGSAARQWFALKPFAAYCLPGECYSQQISDKKIRLPAVRNLASTPRISTSLSADRTTEVDYRKFLERVFFSTLKFQPSIKDCKSWRKPTHQCSGGT